MFCILQAELSGSPSPAYSIFPVNILTVNSRILPHCLFLVTWFMIPREAQEWHVTSLNWVTFGSRKFCMFTKGGK